METPIFKPIGTPVECLDTPSLVLDLGVLERNIKTMHSFFEGVPTSLRPDVSSHLCPAIAHQQVLAGGTSGGICVTTVGQAEIFAQAGFTDILVTAMVVTPLKISRLCSLAAGIRMVVAVDNPSNVEDLSEAATQRGVTVDVVVDINTRLNRFGVEPGQPALDLAQLSDSAPGLNFMGLMTCQGRIIEEDPRQRFEEVRKSVQMVLDTRQVVESTGLDVNLVSVGGTVGYDVAAVMDGVTEVRAGSYALLDNTYRRHTPQFEPAARVMTTVTSLPEDEIIITDGGGKSIGGEWGNPSVDNVIGAEVHGLSAEHVNLRRPAALGDSLSLGSKVWLTPADGATCANLHDYFFGIRDGCLESVWNISARGQYR